LHADAEVTVSDALLEKHVYSASWKVKAEGAVANVVPDAIKASMHEKQAQPLEERKAS